MIGRWWWWWEWCGRGDKGNKLQRVGEKGSSVWVELVGWVGDGIEGEGKSIYPVMGGQDASPLRPTHHQQQQQQQEEALQEKSGTEQTGMVE